MINKQELYSKINSCVNCKLCSLDKNRIRVLPRGFVNSFFMVIGSASSPREQEDENQYYILDKSSTVVAQRNYDLLRKAFLSVELEYDSMWITNVQKCKSANTDIENETFENCYRTILLDEIKQLKPKLIFALGTHVGKILTSEQKLTLNYNKEFDCFIITMYHPSYCTRGYITEEEYVKQLLILKNDIDNFRKNLFINLHHHNQFSLRDGLGSEEDVAKKLVEIRSPGFCLTNHGNVNCHYRQYKAARKYGLKPIYGTEIYYNQYRNQIIECLQSDNKENIARRKELGLFTYHLTVIAKNKQGYYNLISLNNEALMTSFYKFPLIDDELLFKYKDGLIIFSGCAGSYISTKLFEDDKQAYEKSLLYRDAFTDDFYIELMSTKYEHQRNLNNKLIKLAKDINVKTIITNDSHYVKPEHSKVHDIMLLAGSDTKLEDLSDPATKAWTFTAKDLYVKSTVDLFEDLKFLISDNYNSDVLNSSIHTTNEVFNKIDDFNMDTSIKYPHLSEVDSKILLLDLIKKGIEKRKERLVIDDKFKIRLKEEIDVITSLGFTDYFLCLQDIINWTKEKFGKYSVAPGRGSAAASLVSYLLQITDTNPLKYKFMLFERFLSPGRSDAVDIDSDLQTTIRREVLNYAIERFGRNKVFSVGTYGTIKLKTAIHDVLKAMGVEFEEILKYTKRIVSSVELEYMDPDRVLEQFPFLDEIFSKYTGSKEAIFELRDKIRSSGSHAGGLVISGVDIAKHLPLMRTSTGQLVTANTEGGEHHEITELGFVKYDILGLMALDNISYTSELIKKRYNIEIDWEEIQDNESKYLDMFKILHIGDTFGVFQFSSSLATNYLKQLKPISLEDLSAGAALLRPGPLEEKAHLTYSNRKNHIEEITIPDALVPFLGPTHGVLVYQEQFILIVQELCGFSKEEGSNFRKLLMKWERSTEGEKRRRAKILTFKDRVVKGLMQHSISEEEAIRWWEYIEAFAKYAFNRPHSLNYSILSYRQLWQKYYYTIEFYTALLNCSTMEELNEIVKNILKFPARKIIDEKLVEYRISILQPDLRALNADFAVENDGIRHGLKFIKYISEDSVNVMQENFTQDELIDFDKVIDKKYTNNGRQKFIIDKKVATALIYSGALDYLNIKRTELVKIYNQKRSSDIEIIEDDIKLIETEEFYNGYSIKAIEQYSSVRTLIQQRFPDVMNLTDLIQSEYSLGQAIDYVYINSIKLKKTAKGKTFRTISAANIEDTYYPIFIWDKDVDAVAGQKYIAEFAKSDNFIRILRTVRY